MSAAATGKRAGLMQRLKKANASGAGNNFRDGKYRAVVKSMGFKEGFKGTRYQVDFVIMNAQKVEVVSVKTGQQLDITPNQVGSTVDWLCVKLDDPEQPGAGNLKRFVLDLVGAPDASEDDYLETLAKLSDCDEEGDPLPDEEKEEPGRGMLIDIETVRIETKKNKKEIVVLRFSHVPADQYDQDAMCKWLDDVAAFNAQLAQQAGQQQQQLPATTAAA